MQGNLSKLKEIREGMGLTQEALVRRTKSLNLRTYSRAEAGKTTVKYQTAMEILAVINEIRAEAAIAPLKLEDLGLKLY